MHLFVLRNDLPSLRLLCEFSSPPLCDLSLPTATAEKESVLHLAVRGKHASIIEYLVSRAPELLALVDVQGRTPLILLCSLYNRKSLSSSSSSFSSASLSHRDNAAHKSSETAEKASSDRKYVRVCEVLLSLYTYHKRYDLLSYYDIHGWNAMDLCKAKGNLEMMKMILDAKREEFRGDLIYTIESSTTRSISASTTDDDISSSSSSLPLKFKLMNVYNDTLMNACHQIVLNENKRLNHHSTLNDYEFFFIDNDQCLVSFDKQTETKEFIRQFPHQRLICSVRYHPSVSSASSVASSSSSSTVTSHTSTPTSSISLQSHPTPPSPLPPLNPVLRSSQSMPQQQYYMNIDQEHFKSDNIDTNATSTRTAPPPSLSRASSLLVQPTAVNASTHTVSSPYMQLSSEQMSGSAEPLSPLAGSVSIASAPTTTTTSASSTLYSRLPPVPFHRSLSSSSSPSSLTSSLSSSSSSSFSSASSSFSPSLALKFLPPRLFSNIRPLSSGSTSVTSLATYDHQEVVLKRPSKSLIGPSEWNELRIVMSIPPHPNIISLIGILADHHNFSLVTPYVSGGTLEDRLKRNELQDAEEVIQFLIDISKGLSYLHTHCQIIHGDIAARNILYCKKEKKAIITDFGIAQRINKQQQNNKPTQPPQDTGDKDKNTHSDAGGSNVTTTEDQTPPSTRNHSDASHGASTATSFSSVEPPPVPLPVCWLSPERLSCPSFSALPASPSEDIYSLGILSYELLSNTSTPPFSLPFTPGNILHQITSGALHHHLLSPGSYRFPSLPSSLLDLIALCCDENRLARPTSNQVYYEFKSVLRELRRRKEMRESGTAGEKGEQRQKEGERVYVEEHSTTIHETEAVSAINELQLLVEQQAEPLQHLHQPKLW